MLSFFRQTVVRKRPGTKTERGSTVQDWETSTEITISGCFVEPAASSLSQDGRVLGIQDTMTLYMPPSADVIAGDHIVIGTTEYMIDGEPRQWISPTGRVTHVQMNLTRWRG